MVSIKTFDKSGYYLYSKFMGDQETIFDTLIQLYSQLIREGSIPLSMDSAKFQGLGYDELIDWNANLMAEDAMNKAQLKASLLLPRGFVLNWHDQGDRHQMGWVSTVGNRYDQASLYETGSIAESLKRLTTPRSIMTTMTLLELSIPDPNSFMESLLDNVADCTTDEGDYLEYVSVDDIHYMLCSIVAEHLVDIGALAVPVSQYDGDEPELFQYADLDEFRLKLHEKARQAVEDARKNKRGE